MANDISAIKPELDNLTQIIVNTVPVEQVYLFGSYAYGTPNEDSDYDFYVVLKDTVPLREI
jgi:predicted nucleotidyltransferase